jgi:hypothetical protein
MHFYRLCCVSVCGVALNHASKAFLFQSFSRAHVAQMKTASVLDNVHNIAQATWSLFFKGLKRRCMKLTVPYPDVQVSGKQNTV